MFLLSTLQGREKRDMPGEMTSKKCFSIHIGASLSLLHRQRFRQGRETDEPSEAGFNTNLLK